MARTGQTSRNVPKTTLKQQTNEKSSSSVGKNAKKQKSIPPKLISSFQSANPPSSPNLLTSSGSSVPKNSARKNATPIRTFLFIPLLTSSF